MGSINVQAPPPRAEDYDICPHLGFVASDGSYLSSLKPYYDPWNSLLRQLSSLLASRTFRREAQALPLLQTSKLGSDAERRRAYLTLASFTQAYVFEDPDHPEPVVPLAIATPFLDICDYWGLKPILSHIGFCLWNWKIKDDTSPCQGVENVEASEARQLLLQDLDNVESCASFTSTRDEKIFGMVPLLIEAEGGCMVAILLDTLRAAGAGDTPSVVASLEFCVQRLSAMSNHLQLIHQQCDPQIFYHQIRPFIAGSHGMEKKGLPDGIVFEIGNGQHLASQCIGATAGQSSLFQFLDCIFGIQHHSDFLQEMRLYMPRKHRDFLSAVEQLPNLREFVQAHSDNLALCRVFEECVTLLRAWRTKHIGVATRYVVMPARKLASEEGVKGTGGSLPIPFLKETRDETT